MGGQGNSNSLGLISNNLVAACVILQGNVSSCPDACFLGDWRGDNSR